MSHLATWRLFLQKAVEGWASWTRGSWPPFTDSHPLAGYRLGGEGVKVTGDATINKN